MPRLRIALWLLMCLFIGKAFAGGAQAPNGVGVAISEQPSEAAFKAWVARRGWHIDIGLAVADLQAPLRSVAAQFPQTRYVFFGFGDRRYLTAKRRGSSSLLAALWPGAGLMLVTAIGSDPVQAFGERQVRDLNLNEPQMLALQRFIWQSFEADNQAATIIGPGPYEGSLYFAAQPRYSGLHTCNSWAAEGLAGAGLPIRHRFVLLAGQLWSQLKKREARPGHAEPSLAGADP